MHVPIDIGKLTFGDGTSCYSFNSMHWGMASKVAVTAEKLRYGTTPSPPPKIAPISPRALLFFVFSKLLLFEKISAARVALACFNERAIIIVRFYSYFRFDIICYCNATINY